MPLSSLGIVFDNPSSAEAMYAAQNDLIVEAEWLNASNGQALKNVALMALSCLRGTTIEALPKDDLTIEARFANPVRPSMAARADFALKVASAVPEYPQTTQFWRDLGYDEAEIREVMRDTRRIRAQQLAQAMAAQQQAQAAGGGGE